jgi:hypothetical protein
MKVEVALWSLTINLGKTIKKLDVLFVQEECRILTQATCYMTSLFGLNLSFRYFYMWIFFIKGCFELRGSDFDEFNLLSLPIDIVLKFCQAISNNWKIDITYCFADWHRPIVHYPICNVIKTFKKLIHWCPFEWLGEKLGPHLLFLHHKPRWKAFDEIWFYDYSYWL